MATDSTKVDNLKKISLKIEAGNTPATMDLTTGPETFEFIFGIGANGITPFEYELANKAPGDQFQFHVRHQEFSHFFEHFTQPIRNIIGRCDCDLYLQGSVDAVSTPGNREIIKAMAGSTSGCEDGCCGDGCCDHS
jgi:hypothetical protein